MMKENKSNKIINFEETNNAIQHERTTTLSHTTSLPPSNKERINTASFTKDIT